MNFKVSHHHHHHHHHISVMELAHLLTRSGLTHPEVSSRVCHDSFCQLGNSVSLPWVIYYEAFYLHVVSSFSCIPVICLKLVLFLFSLQFVYLFCNLSFHPLRSDVSICTDLHPPPFVPSVVLGLWALIRTVTVLAFVITFRSQHHIPFISMQPHLALFIPWIIMK